MFRRFSHEAEYYPQLSRVPLHVRMKLDTAGIKLSLRQWLDFSLEERNVLCHLPVEHREELEAFSGYLGFLCRKYDGKEAQAMPAESSRPWEDLGRLPERIAQKSQEQGPPVSLEEWRNWQPAERYALYKTAVSESEPEKFFAVLADIRRQCTES